MIALIAAALFFAPWVSEAGDHTRPELRDSTGDSNSLGGGKGDIVQGWMSNESARSVVSNLQVTGAGAEDMRANFGFTVYTPKGDEKTSWQLGFRFFGGAAEWTLREHDSDGNTRGEASRVKGFLKEGSPAVISWVVPKDLIMVAPSDVLRRFWANSSVVSPPAEIEMDRAGPSYTAFVIDSGINGFEPPRFQADFTDEMNDTDIPATDLLGFWIEKGNFSVLTFSLRSFELSNLVCENWENRISLTAEGHSLRFSQNLRRGSFGSVELMVDGEMAQVKNRVQQGSPGYFRFETTTLGWLASDAGPTGAVETDCDARPSSHDRLEFGSRQETAAPNALFVWVAVSVAFAVLFRGVKR